MSVLPLICCQQMISWREFFIFYGFIFDFDFDECVTNAFESINSIEEERTSQSKRNMSSTYLPIHAIYFTIKSILRTKFYYTLIAFIY